MMRVSEPGTGAGTLTSGAEGAKGEKVRAATKLPRHEATTRRRALLPQRAFWTGRLARTAACTAARTRRTTSRPAVAETSSALMIKGTSRDEGMAGPQSGACQHEAARYHTSRSEQTSRGWSILDHSPRGERGKQTAMRCQSGSPG